MFNEDGNFSSTSLINISFANILIEGLTCLCKIHHVTPHLSMISNFLALMKKRGSKLTCQDTVKGTCETTFSCFTYMTSNRKPQYGCVLGETRHLFMCNAGPTTTFVAKCCNEDMCNGRLNLSMPEGGEPKKENSKFVFMRVLDCCPMNKFFFGRLRTFKCYRK
jgi:hypothetical protein